MIVKLITGFIARFIASFFRHGNPDKKQESISQEEVVTNDGQTRCPECGTPYDLNDYRKDIAEIFCSACKAKLTR